METMNSEQLNAWTRMLALLEESRSSHFEIIHFEIMVRALTSHNVTKRRSCTIVTVSFHPARLTQAVNTSKLQLTADNTFQDEIAFSWCVEKRYMTSLTVRTALRTLCTDDDMPSDKFCAGLTELVYGLVKLNSIREFQPIDLRALNRWRNVLNVCNLWLNIVSKKSTQICYGGGDRPYPPWIRPWAQCKTTTEHEVWDIWYYVI